MVFGSLSQNLKNILAPKTKLKVKIMTFKHLKPLEDESRAIFNFCLISLCAFIIFILVFAFCGCGPVGVEIAESIAEEVIEDTLIYEHQKLEHENVKK